jgi:hypothetical protein
VGYPEGDPQAQPMPRRCDRASAAWAGSGGRNIRTEYRRGGTDPKKGAAFAKELIGMSPDVIVSSTN